MIKSLYTLAFLIVSASCFSQQYVSTRLDGDLAQVIPIGVNSAVAYGSNGVILVTRDEGLHWKQAKGIKNTYFTCGAADGNGSIVLGSFINNIMFFSSNYGETWKLINFSFPDSSNIREISCIENGVFAISDNIGNLFSFTPQDKSLKKIYSSPNAPSYCTSFFYSAKRGFAFHGDSLMFSTFDGGKTWMQQPVAGFLPSMVGMPLSGRSKGGTISFEIADPATGIVNLVLSQDSGKTWKYMSFNLVGRNISWIKDTVFVAISGQTSIQKYSLNANGTDIRNCITPDYDVPEYMFLRSTTVLNDSTVIAVGNYKSILQSNDAAASFSLKSHYFTLPYQGWSPNFFLNDSTGTYIDRNNCMYQTTNYGDTWQIRLNKSPINNRLSNDKIYYLSDSILCTVGSFKGIYYSFNGGKDWSSSWHSLGWDQYDFESLDYSEVISKDSVILIFNDNTIYEVTNNFSTWTLRSTVMKPWERIDSNHEVTKNLSNITKIKDSLYIFNTYEYENVRVAPNRWDMGYNKSFAVRTRDMFKTFDTLFIVNDNVGFKAFYVGNGKIVLSRSGNATEKQIEYESTDYGDTWLKTRESAKASWGILPRDTWIGTNSFRFSKGAISMSFDSAATWQTIYPAGDSSIFGILDFRSPSLMYMYTGEEISPNIFAKGVLRIEKLSDAVSDVEVGENAPVRSLVWVKNPTPTPFNNVLRFVVGHTSNVDINSIRVKICNINGELVEDITSQFRNSYSGNESLVTWSNSLSVPSGVYFVVVNSGGVVSTLKVIKSH